MEEKYSVKKLSKQAGVSIRTLHHYDDIGLLKPAVRTEAGYRMYGDKEMLKLQQILFFKELEFPLTEIQKILNSGEFETLEALAHHKKVLKAKQKRISTLISTIDQTLEKLKKGENMKIDELYKGFSRQEAEGLRQEALKKWGEKVTHSEEHLTSLGKEKVNRLQTEFKALWMKLSQMTKMDPTSEPVQHEIEYHYKMVQQFWGPRNPVTREAYIGLGEMYVHDDRYTSVEGRNNPEMGAFLNRAVKYFAEHSL
ncbi:MAG: MerR family transcriptional regulator [Candidatus Marinimicrobia bacterium]|nr:MerR family transcriptional regulator [Candidatus Neomarinimicrobiota bacterium]